MSRGRALFLFNVDEVRLAVASRVRGRDRDRDAADAVVGRGYVGRDAVREAPEIEPVRLKSALVRSTGTGTRLRVVLRLSG